MKEKSKIAQIFFHKSHTIKSYLSTDNVIRLQNDPWTTHVQLFLVNAIDRYLYHCTYLLWACVKILQNSINTGRPYCRFLNFCGPLGSRFGNVWRSRSFSFAGVTAGVVLCSYTSIIFPDIYFRDSKEPLETRIKKGSQKLKNLQYNVDCCKSYAWKPYYLISFKGYDKALLKLPYMQKEQ